ncbi:arginine--tRNA ligase [Alicyclobacillaceae bacterium I2511]|nr:arginine--tRNA ligase [Alicyclobacillaceae bacterium I2511]
MKSQKMQVARLVAPVVGHTEAEVAGLLEYPPDPKLGDLALPCFRFAKTLRKSPQTIAAELATMLGASQKFDQAVATGGYVNIHLLRQVYAQAVMAGLDKGVDAWLSQRRGQGQRVAVDFSSPNIAKPFGVGHLRSTLIGQSIGRLLTADGWQVLGVNHLGDWGTQFGKNIAAYLRWGDEETVRQNPVRELFQLYVRFHKEAESQPELEDVARAWFKKLENGDPQATHLWRWFIDESLAVFQRTYDRLGVHFEYVLGESFYNDKMQPVIDELQQRGLLSTSDGADVVDLSEWNMPPCIIRKSDGATIYATRDLAAALYRHDQLHANRLLYVVGSEQALHFAQVFKVLELMEREWAQNCQHISFGMMKYQGERLSTRRGKVVYLEDVLDKAVEEAYRIIENKNPQLADKQSVAEAVGIGAVAFNDLKTYRTHDVDFRYEEVLNFDGETGPYVQYTHARASSVLRKAAAAGFKSGITVPPDPSEEEWQLTVTLGRGPEWLERAVDELDPSLLARYLLDLCHSFNRFYHSMPILNASVESQPWRLALTQSTRGVLAFGLYLLGIKAPDAM